jgi:hypothetical protein
MRKIKVFSTATGLKIVESSAITWGELKEQLSNEDISVSNVKAVENKTNTTLELDDAKLPESDFVLMLSPEKTKSGGYKEVRETIQTIISLNGQIAKDHFNEGKNYTIKSYSELESLLASWYELCEEDTNDYDNEYEEGKVYFHNCIDKIIYEIRNCSEYNSRPDSMEKAIELIAGTKTINDLCIDNQKIMSNLTSEELNWLNKFK